METNSPKNNGYRFYIITNILFILLLLCIFCMCGCAAKPIETTSKIEHHNEVKKDSTKVIETNKAINDTLKIKIAKVKTSKPECDSITQAKINELLRQLNTSKKSGDNEAGIYYDELKQQLVMWQLMAQTKNEKTTTNKSSEVTTKLELAKPVIVKFIPKWVQVLAWIGSFTVAYGVYRVSRIFV